MASIKNTSELLQDSDSVSSPDALTSALRSASGAYCCQSCNAAVRAAGRARFEDVYEPIAGSRCGYGSTSVVVQVRRRSDGRVFACKVCYVSGHLCGDDNNNCQKITQIRREIEIMNILGRMSSSVTQGGSPVSDGDDFTNYKDSADIDDHGIAMCVDAFVSNSCNDSSTAVYIVSKLMKGGDLRSSLEERGSYTEDDARDVMKQLLRSLVYLHDEAGITHRDIKLENILLPSALDPAMTKLSDFGLSACGTSARPSMKQRCGTPVYVAPEILELASLYSNKVDLWSSGVVLFMLLCGYPPFWGNSMRELQLSIIAARPNFNDPVWELISEEAIDLVQKLLKKNPEERLSAREALLHPWLS